MTIDPILIQSIADSCYFGGDGLACALNQLTGAFGGQGLFGLFLGSVIFVAFYIGSSGELAPPTVALILVGTVAIPMVPGHYERIAYGVVVIGLSAAVWQVLQQYVMSGAVR